MKQLYIGSAIVFFLLVLSTLAFPWGFYAHKMIVRNAVLIQPPPLIGFYKANLPELVDASVQPDIRRYVNSDEEPRHYIDLDLYGEDADSVIGYSWGMAVEKFGLDTLSSRGTVPWSIISTYYDLMEAFRTRNANLIIRYSADLSHYISDAHVPLHTTHNYNGQYTDQEGIHRLWESLIPENNAENYSFWVGKAEYINDIYGEVRGLIAESHSLVDSVLSIERRLSEITSPDLKYSFQTRGNQEVRLYSKEYISSYEMKLDGMVERRMQSSVKMTADFWYTSWVEAGQPDLSDLKAGKIGEITSENMDTVEAPRRARLHNP